MSPAPFLVAAVALAAGFLLGRSSAPARVEVREVERVRVQLQERTATASAAASASDTRAARDVERVRVVKSDGTRIERTRVRARVEQHQAHAEQHQAHAEVQLQQESARERVSVTTSQRPSWRAGALVGLQLRELRLPPGPLLYGAHVERRVLGPLWLGAWGLSSGAAGLSLSAEF